MQKQILLTVTLMMIANYTGDFCLAKVTVLKNKQILSFVNGKYQQIVDNESNSDFRANTIEQPPKPQLISETNTNLARYLKESDRKMIITNSILANLLHKNVPEKRHEIKIFVAFDESSNSSSISRTKSEIICRDGVVRMGLDLLEQHLKVLSFAADGLLTDKAKTIVSQRFMDNLLPFVEKHCSILNGAFQAQDEDVAKGAAFEQILQLAYVTFGEISSLPEETKKLNGSSDEHIANLTGSGVEIINSTIERTITSERKQLDLGYINNPNIIGSSSSNNYNIRGTNENNPSEPEVQIAKSSDSTINRHVSTTTRPTTTTSDSTKASELAHRDVAAQYRQFKVLAGLRPRGLILRMNKTMKIAYNEYMDNYSKRLLVFENETLVVVMVGASRYHLHGVSSLKMSICL